MIPEDALDAALVQLEAMGSYVPRKYVRAALEAAAPYMLATVYEEGWLSARDFYLHSDGPAGGLDENPYRRSE